MAKLFDIQLYRGTETNLPASASVAGMPAHVTDIDAMVVGDGSTNWSALPYLRGAAEVVAGTPSGGEAAQAGLFKFDGTNDILYVSDGVAWIDCTSSAGAVALNDLSDVTVGSESQYDVLVYDSGWGNAALNIDHLGDVSAAAPSEGDVLMMNDSSTWVPAALDLDDVADSATYQRVAAAYVDASSRISHIYNVGGTVAAEVDDAGTTTADLWTANQIQSAIDQAIDGLDWQESVLDYVVDNTGVPASEVTGDRYILSHDGGVPHVNYDGAAAGDIVEFNGSTWDAITPTEGAVAFAEDADTDYLFNGSSQWVTKASTTTHNNLGGLDQGDYHHLTSAEHTEITTFFASTDILAAEAETLTAGTSSDADGLHTHPALDVISARGAVIVGDASGDAAQVTVGAVQAVLQSDGTDTAFSTVIDCGTF